MSLACWIYKWYKWSHLQIRNRLTDSENKLTWLPKRKKECHELGFETSRYKPLYPLCCAKHSCSILFNSLWPFGPFAHQAPLSTGIFRQEYWSELPFSSSRGSFQLRDQIHVSCIPCISGRFFTLWVIGKAQTTIYKIDKQHGPAR